MDAQSSGISEDSTRSRVLLLYGEPAQAASLMQRLPPERYDIITCPGASPRDWLQDLQPELALLALPSNEERLLAACRAVRLETESPVIVLSALNGESAITSALATGIDDYLVEPLGDRELVARIEAMLRRVHRVPASDDVRRIGDLVLSTSEHAVTRAGRRVVLSPIEFRLLACLASAPGKVLTHQTLMSRVWGAEYVDSKHYLRVYIRYLREKLEDDPNHPQLVLSEWGVGYRLHVPPRAVVETQQTSALAFTLRPAAPVSP